MNGSSAVLMSGDISDQETKGNRDQDGEKITQSNSSDRITELDSQAFIVRPVIIKRTLEVLPQFAADIDRPGHRRFALRCGRPHQLRIFRAHVRDNAAPPRGDMPDCDEAEEQRDRDDGRAKAERGRQLPAPDCGWPPTRCNESKVTTPS